MDLQRQRWAWAPVESAKHLKHLRRTKAGSLTQELICAGEPLQNVLRLLALVTLTAGGIPKKYYDSLRREILHTYGHENILTLSRLQDAGAAHLSA